MRQLIIVAISIAAFVVPALAQQETPSVEVFGGYQFSHFTPSINANGWNTAVTGNVNRWFGITGDVSGSYKNGGHMYTYMVGPTLSARTEQWQSEQESQPIQRPTPSALATHLAVR
jgi:hypothetical protein